MDDNINNNFLKVKIGKINWNKNKKRGILREVRQRVVLPVPSIVGRQCLALIIGVVWSAVVRGRPNYWSSETQARTATQLLLGLCTLVGRTHYSRVARYVKHKLVVVGDAVGGFFIFFHFINSIFVFFLDLYI